MKILIVVAHPDDEVLGMGGTIKKLTKNNNEVKIIFMATGIFSRRSASDISSTNYHVSEKIRAQMSERVKKLQNNARQAAKMLGVKNIEFMDFPDNEMDKASNLEITKKIEKVLEDFRPTEVYTHSQFDINVDHQAIYFATLTATRPRQNYYVKKVVSFEVPSSTEWNFPQKFSPNMFVDISKELPFKIKALKVYKNEIRKYPHPRSVMAIEAISRRWGTVSGFNNAEAFCLVRELQN